MNLNTEHRSMEDKSVTAFLLSPHYRTYRHLLLQAIVLLTVSYTHLTLPTKRIV